MQTSSIKTVPPGDFAEISIQMPDWQEKFLGLVQQSMPIKYDIYAMPTLPANVEQELAKRGYSHLILQADDWQHFLVPKSKQAQAGQQRRP